jgi:hypothetical protein
MCCIGIAATLTLVANPSAPLGLVVFDWVARRLSPAIFKRAGFQVIGIDNCFFVNFDVEVFNDSF